MCCRGRREIAAPASTPADRTAGPRRYRRRATARAAGDAPARPASVSSNSMRRPDQRRLIGVADRRRVVGLAVCAISLAIELILSLIVAAGLRGERLILQGR